MAETAEQADGVLARKLAAVKESGAAQADALLLRALRRSFARAAMDVCGLAATALAARQTLLAPEDLGGWLSDEHLLVVLDGPEGRIGAAALDTAAVTALIQQQTMGQVLGLASSQRAYTPTDAAMMADFLERAFARTVQILEDFDERRPFEGYQFGAMVADARSLLLALEDDEYRVIEMNFDLANGAMQGEILLILPEPLPEDDGGSEGLSGPTLAASMGGMRAELTAILCRMHVPLNTLSGLKSGDLLPLDQAFLYETSMQAINGQVVARGRLGQINGARAVRLNQPRTRLVSDTGGDDFSTQIAVPGGRGGLQPADIELAAEPFDAEGFAGGGMPDMPAASAAGPTAEAPAAEPEAGFPDMGDLPALDDLPDLGGLPDLPDDFPSLDELGGLPGGGDEPKS